MEFVILVKIKMVDNEVKKIIGAKRQSKTPFNLVFPENKTTTLNQNLILLARQGTGKSNLLMGIVYQLIKAYIEEDSRFGAIPIVFAPLFELTQLTYPSKNENLAPYQVSEGIDCLQFSFKIANPPEDSDIRIIGLDFNKLTQEDICAFAGFSGDLKVLGNVQKILISLKKDKPNYDIDDFLEIMWEDKSLRDALYYVFSRLKEEGFFDSNLEQIDWMSWIRERKPIIFNFGDIDDKFLYNSITGILLGGLWDLSIKFYNAFQKSQRLSDRRIKGLEIEEKHLLDDDDEFLLKNFWIALLFDEAHQIFNATKSTELKYFPAHYYYKKISDLMGRKRGFKYNLLVTQKIMELYYGFRKSFNSLYLGSIVYQNDRDYMNSELGIKKDDIGVICRLRKYEWAVVNLDRYHSKLPRSVAKFKAYLSPAGQPV